MADLLIHKAIELNICIGGDLEGQSFDFDKSHFKAKEVEEGKTSEYRRQPYIIGDDLYLFWISNDLDSGRFDLR